MIDKDDDDWVTLLGGGTVPDVAERTRAEAERLRLASAQARAVHARDTDAFDAEGAWGKVVEEGRRTGAFAEADWMADFDVDLALAPPPEEEVQKRPAGRRWAVWSGLSAAVIALLWFGAQPMLVGTRGGPEHLPPILRALPKEDATRIADELAAAGATAAVTVSSTSEGTTASITVDTGAPGRPGKAVDEVLARHGVAPPNGGRFVIEVRRSEPVQK